MGSGVDEQAAADLEEVWAEAECRTGEEDMRSTTAGKEGEGGRRSPPEATVQKWRGSTSSV
jgi:hypothetical protein